MARERLESASYVDLIDRILDKGVVIEAVARLSVGGIDLMTIETHVIETIVAHAAVFMTNGFPPPAPLLIHTLLDWR